MTGVVLLFEWGEVLFKSGVAFARIRYMTVKLLLRCTYQNFNLNCHYYTVDTLLSMGATKFNVILAGIFDRVSDAVNLYLVPLSDLQSKSSLDLLCIYECTR